MSRVVQARLDDETAALVAGLKKRTGWNDSEIIREAIKTLSQATPKRRRKLSGLGEFNSGILDLATNPKHMEGFGEI